MLHTDLTILEAIKLAAEDAITQRDEVSAEIAEAYNKIQKLEHRKQVLEGLVKGFNDLERIHQDFNNLNRAMSNLIKEL